MDGDVLGIPDLKTGVGQLTVGSNPTPSANPRNLPCLATPAIG